LNPSIGKLAIVLVVILAIYSYLNYQKNQTKQQQLKQEILSLEQHTINQEKIITKRNQQVKALADTHMDKITKKMDEVQKQSEKLDRQMQTLKTATKDLDQKQQLEKERISAAEKNKQATLKAFHIAQGFQSILPLKVRIAEHFMSTGRFPNSNDNLGVAKPAGFATDVIQSIWISKGGRITIVYTEKSGVDKGAISFTPYEKNHQLNWKCSTKDFVNITRFMPQCHYEQ